MAVTRNNVATELATSTESTSRLDGAMKTGAIRDLELDELEPHELDAISGGQHARMDVYHPNPYVQAFLRGCRCG